MQDYRLYRVNWAGRIFGPPELRSRVTDGEALKAAEELGHNFRVEVWQGARLVGAVEPATNDDEAVTAEWLVSRHDPDNDNA